MIWPRPAPATFDDDDDPWSTVERCRDCLYELGARAVEDRCRCQCEWCGRPTTRHALSIVPDGVVRGLEWICHRCAALVPDDDS